MRAFAFDTVFDDRGEVAFEAPPPKKHAFTAEEVETARLEGYAQGEHSAVVKARRLRRSACGRSRVG